MIDPLLNYYENNLKSKEAYPFDSYGADAVPALGFDVKNIGVEILIDEDGKIKSINRIEFKREIVPYVARTRNVMPRFCCDNIKYLIVEDNWREFIKRHKHYLSGLSVPEIKSFLKFLSKYTSEDLRKKLEDYKILSAPNSNIDKKKLNQELSINVIFNISSKYLHRIKKVTEKWQQIWREWLEIKTVEGIDLINGLPSIDLTDFQPMVLSTLKLFSNNKKSTGHYGLSGNLVSPTSFENTLKLTRTIETLYFDPHSCIKFKKGDISVLFWNDGANKLSIDILKDLFMGKEKPINKSTLSNVMCQYRKLSLKEHSFNDRIHFLTIETPANGHLKILSYEVAPLNEFTENVVKYTELFFDNCAILNIEGVLSAIDLCEILGEIRSNHYEVFKTLMDFVIHKRQLPLWFQNQLINSILKAEWPSKKGNKKHFRLLTALLFTIVQLNLKNKGDIEMYKDNPLYVIGKLAALNECIRETNGFGRQTMIKDAFANPSRYFSRVYVDLDNVIKGISRSNKGLSVYYNRLLEDIMRDSQLENSEIPSRITNNDKNAFIFGYTGMKNRFFSKKEKETLCK